MPLYNRRGFLRARFSKPHAALATAQQTDWSASIVVSIPVEEGPGFVWDGATWSGNRVLATADLDAKLAMKRGEVADGEKIERGLNDVHKAYGSLGYMQANFLTQQVLDDSARRAQYRVTISEGQQYHMGVVTFSGLSTGTASRLMKAWKLKPGDVFDASYAGEFLMQSFSKIQASEGIRCSRVDFEYNPDDQKTIVDVRISCH